MIKLGITGYPSGYNYGNINNCSAFFTIPLVNFLKIILNFGKERVDIHV
jgi:hypothetical protein